MPSGIRQADPYGTYWDAAGHWRRRLQQQHPYNCRAHQAGGAFSFSTLLPGYYVAGAGWRPRHVHIRVQARDLAAISPLSRVHAQVAALPLNGPEAILTISRELPPRRRPAIRPSSRRSTSTATASSAPATRRAARASPTTRR